MRFQVERLTVEKLHKSLNNFHYHVAGASTTDRQVKPPKALGYSAYLVANSGGAAGFVRYVTLPIAAVVGTIGVYLESKWRKPAQPIPYLETSLVDARMQRQMQEEQKDDFARYEGLQAEKKSIVPSSLLVNTGRRQPTPS